MALEATSRNEKNSVRFANVDADVARLLGEYKNALLQSGLPKVDVQESLKKLEAKPVTELKADHLKGNLRYVQSHEAERKVKEQRDKYGKKIDDLIKNKQFPTDPSKKADYIKWFLEQPFDEREKVLKEPFFQMNERKKASEAWKRIPEAERNQHPEYDKLGVEQRLLLVERLAAEHKQLKDAFLKLPAETQKKYQAQFKGRNLKDRAALLKAISGISGGESGEADGKGKLIGPERLEEKRSTTEYKKKSAQMVEQNLLTGASKAAYDDWFEQLPLDKKPGDASSSLFNKRHMLNHSELDTRLGDRKNVRDEFYGLSPELRGPIGGPVEMDFRTRDLDRRRELIDSLKNPEKKGHGEHKKYPDDIMHDKLKRTLDDQSLQEMRLVYTLLHGSQTLRKRAEISHDSKKTDVIAKKTEEKGGKVDEHSFVNLAQLEHHGEARFHAKEFQLSKEADGHDAKATNMTLLDKNLAKVTADQFKELVVDHKRKELIARMVAGARAKLPGIKAEELHRVAQKMELRADLHKVTTG